MSNDLYKAEIKRAYKVLSWPAAKVQNSMDIRGWLGCGFIKPLEAKVLMELNARLALEYEKQQNRRERVK